jgi:hypothetical protein
VLIDLILQQASDGSNSMVVFVDLDRDDSFSEHQHHASALSLEKPFPPKLTVAPIAITESSDLLPSPASFDEDREADSADALANKSTEVENPNRNAFSAALSCYPYVDP